MQQAAPHDPHRLAGRGAPGPGPGGDRRDGGADHLHAQPRDGRRTGIARAAARSAGGLALPGAGDAAANGFRLRPGWAPHAVDRRRAGRSGAGGHWRGLRGGVDGHLAQRRHRAGGGQLRGHRRRCQRQRHFAAGAAGQARARGAPRPGRHHRLDDDDRRLRGHGRCRRQAAGALLARTPGRRDGGGVRRRVPDGRTGAARAGRRGRAATRRGRGAVALPPRACRGMARGRGAPLHLRVH